MGCSVEAAEASARASGRHLHKGVVGAYLSQSLTCCRSGAGRVPVLVVRHPYARFWSAFEQAARGYAGPVSLGVFERWAERLFRAWPAGWALGERWGGGSSESLI